MWRVLGAKIEYEARLVARPALSRRGVAGREDASIKMKASLPQVVLPYVGALIALLITSYPNGLQVLAAQSPPLGVYLWYPGPAQIPTEEDCFRLIEQIQPSRDRAEDWLWGRVPEGPAIGKEFYLFLSGTRMETTFSAEGDYDFGSVQFGQTRNGTTSFTLIREWTEHGGHAARFLFATVSRPSRTAALVTATR